MYLFIYLYERIKATVFLASRAAFPACKASRFPRKRCLCQIGTLTFQYSARGERGDNKQIDK